MIGRALGVGVRVVGRMAGQILEGPPPATPGAPQAHRAAPVAAPQFQNPNRQSQTAGRTATQATMQAAQTVSHATRSVSRGAAGFFRPFRRVGGILWLEITGVFFLLPVAVFAPFFWREAIAYHHTSDHKTLWVTGGVMALFLYLSVSSFWRARRRSKQS